jgi:hypothetical protein
MTGTYAPAARCPGPTACMCVCVPRAAARAALAELPTDAPTVARGGSRVSGVPSPWLDCRRGGGLPGIVRVPKKGEARPTTGVGDPRCSPVSVSAPAARDRNPLGVPFASSRLSPGGPNRGADRGKNVKSASNSAEQTLGLVSAAPSTRDRAAAIPGRRQRARPLKRALGDRKPACGRPAAGQPHRSVSSSGPRAGGRGVTFYSLGRPMGC